jgi:hypothetical protein
MSLVDPQHVECPDCVFFNPNRANRLCRSCGIGEHFQERVSDLELNAREILKFRKMRHDGDE